MLNGLDLFSGIGGISQALAPWVRTLAYCERDRACQRILLSRMSRGEIEIAPVWDDVTTLRGAILPPIDIITAGFPCQDLSSAGLRTGLGGPRSGLFRHVLRLASETAAPLICLENVQGVAPYIPGIRSEIEALGYEVRDGFLSASDVGARHERVRWFAVAYSDRYAKRIQRGWRQRQKWSRENEPVDAVETRETTDLEIERERAWAQRVRDEAKQPFSLSALDGNTWNEYASFLLRMDHGLPHRSDTIRALGNGVVPQQVEAAFKIITGVR